MVNKSIRGVWSSIAQIEMDLGDICISISALIQKGCWYKEQDIFFKDVWCGGETLKELCPNLYAFDRNQNYLIIEKRCMVSDFD